MVVETISPFQLKILPPLFHKRSETHLRRRFREFAPFVALFGAVELVKWGGEWVKFRFVDSETGFGQAFLAHAL